MTVKEAKKKWCCQDGERCNPNKCTAWQWLGADERENGYCGIAGCW